MVGGHLYCLLFNVEELWPFGSYSLYVESRDTSQAEQYVFVGVTAGDPASEVEVFRTESLIRPHYRATLHGTFGRLARRPDAGARLATAAADVLRLYEVRRQRGLHDGPGLVGGRVYLYIWRYDSVDPVSRAPTGRRLLAEHSALEPGASR